MQKHLLLAEDDIDDQNFFVDAIRKIDSTIKVTIVNNGREALDYLSAAPILPDLVFLDINMPLMSGIECLYSIRKTSLLQALPVLILSTAGDPITVSIARRLGANGYLKKPYSSSSLCVHLAKVIAEDFSSYKETGKVHFIQLLDSGILPGQYNS